MTQNALQIFFWEVKLADQDTCVLVVVVSSCCCCLFCFSVCKVFFFNISIQQWYYSTQIQFCLCYGPEEISDWFFFRNNGVVILQAHLLGIKGKYFAAKQWCHHPTTGNTFQFGIVKIISAHKIRKSSPFTGTPASYLCLH